MDSGFILKVDPVGFADRLDVGCEGECVLSRATEVFSLRSVVKFELPVSYMDIQVQMLIRQFGCLCWEFTGEVGFRNVNLWV